MSKLTNNTKLTLPENSEIYDIDIVNANTQKIDNALGGKADLDQSGKILAKQIPISKWIVESGQFTGAVSGHLSTTVVWDYNKYNNGSIEATAKFDLGAVTLSYNVAAGNVFRLNSSAYYFDFQLVEKFATVDHIIATGKNNNWIGPISQSVQEIGVASCRIYPTNVMNITAASTNVFYLQVKGTWR